MCGICGCIDLRPEPAPPIDVQPMLDAMVHRGPDSEGRYEAPGIVAGIRRLAVIDVPGGNQPIANEDGSVEVVFNGELYNFGELKRELETAGHRFRTRSDTEVLVHLWEEHGPELLHRIRGMFAFCLHDRRQRRTLIARDRLGIKPLYYRRDGDRLDFASELPVLLAAPGDTPSLDHDALLELFSLQYVSGERTIYDGVFELLPGHRMEIRDGQVVVDAWWRLPAGAVPASGNLPEAAEELRGLIREAVLERRVADVPLGVFLSGGLDSSAICAALAGLSDRPVQSFSVGFEGPEAFDEREQARIVVEHFGTEHHEWVTSPIAIAELLPELVAHLGMPVADPALLPTWQLSRFARERVTVALSGEGADELFGGYRRYVYQNRFGWIGRVPGIRRAGRSLDGVLPGRVGQALEAVGQDGPARIHAAWAATLGPALARRLFDDRAVDRLERRTADHGAAYFPEGEIRLADQLRADQSEWLPHNLLAKVDRASMAHSLEARVPFLDHRIVEWAAQQPDDLKIRGATTKLVLREAVRPWLPESTIRRPKQGFDLPLASWIRGPLLPLARNVFDRESTDRRWSTLKPEAASALLDEHVNGNRDHGLPLFLLVSVLTFLHGRP